MLIEPSRLRKWLRVEPHGVLHVGAHRAEELHIYREAQFGRVLWVEAQSNLIPAIQKSIEGSADLVFEGVVWSETGLEKNFQITSNGESSSLLKLAERLQEYPDIVVNKEIRVQTIRLDELIPTSEGFDFLNLDIQGAELEALKGLGQRINDVRWVYSEVNRRGLYEEIPLVEELDKYLGSFGFERIVTLWKKAGWGDALYVKKNLPIFTRLRIRWGALVVLVQEAINAFQDSQRNIRKRLRRRLFRMIDRLRGL